MSKIDFLAYLNNINFGHLRYYMCSTEVCYFPFLNEEIDMTILSKELNKFGQYLNHEESFFERKYMAENNIQWINFTQQLKKERKYTCEISKFTHNDIKRLSHDIFNVKYDETWANSWLVIHHKDDKQEYECYDKNNLLVLNRAVHLIKHRYNNLVKYLPALQTDYKLWFELGSLIHDRNGEYPWRHIVKKND